MTTPLPIHYVSIANMIASLGLVGYLAYHHSTASDVIPQGASTSTQAPQQSNAPTSSAPSFVQVFHDLEEPLQDIAIQKGVNPSSLLPSNDDLQAAIASNDIHSQASQKVLDIYKASYELHELPYPALHQREQDQKEPAAQKSGAQIIKAYFQGQMMRIARASQKQNISVEELLPTNEEILQASNSEDISSPDAQKAIQKIQRAYDKLNIPFHPPTEQ